MRTNTGATVAKQTITVRLDEDDLTYLSSVEVAGAATVSDKLRALLADARRQHEGMREYAAAHDFARRLFGEPERCLRDAEVQVEMRSEVLARVLSFLPELTALVLSGSCTAARPARDRSENLKRFERAVGERVMSLVDSFLQLATSGFAGCYDPPALARRSQSIHRILAGAAMAPGSANEEKRP
jgi:hypothetical protein